MKQSLKNLGPLVLAGALLAGCNSTPNESSSSLPSSESSSSQSEGSSSSSQGSSSEAAEEYVIAVSVSSGLHLSVSHAKAAKGTTVTITVDSIDAGFVLRHLYMNGSELYAGDDGKYVFTMPNRSVEITADVMTDGDVVLAGDISAKLVEEVPGSGLYVARNVKVESKASFSFYAFNKELKVTDVDYLKCMADIEAGSSKTSNSAISISGGCTYDFFYDDKAEHHDGVNDNGPGRCYIRRVSVDRLPDDASSLMTIFDGQTRSESTEHLVDLKSAHYINRVADVEYNFNNYEDGSLATANSIANPENSKGVVYKQVKDGVYTKIDTYLERKEMTTDPSTTYEASAGRYGIYGKWSDIPEGYSRYATFAHDANLEAHESGHRLQGLRYAMQNAFYVGYDKTFTDGLQDYSINIASEEKDYGFDVKISSYREIQDAGLQGGTPEYAYYTYEATLAFTKAGEPLSGTYLGKKYGSDSYNFSTHKITDETIYTTVGDIEYEYAYGQASGTVEFDTSAYLSTSITATIRDPKVDDPDLAGVDAIAVAGNTSADTLNSKLKISSNLGLDGDFLDAGNYTIVSVSNPEVVGLRSPKGPFEYLPLAEGKTDVVIGNPTVPSAPTYTIHLEVVDSVTVRSFYMTGEDGVWSSSQNLLTTSSSFSMEAGTIRRFRVYGSVGDYTNVPFTPVSSNPDLLKVERYVVNNQAYILYDATEAVVEKATTLTVTIQSTRYDSSWGLGETKFTVTLLPQSSFSYFGEWCLITAFDDAKAEVAHATAVDKNTTVRIREYVEGNDASLSKITLNGTEYVFQFHFDPLTKLYTITKVSNNFSTLYLDETVDGYLGVCLVGNDGSWSGLDETTSDTVLLGSIVDNEDGDLQVSYDSFDLVSNW